MEDIIERVRYPSAPLIKCPRPPIGEGELTALMRDLQNEPTFRGVWTLADDSCPVAILHALDERNFRAARTNMSGVLAWNWNHRFGRLLSFTLVVPGERSPRIFVPDDCALARAVSERGRIAFAVSYGKRLSPFYLADFTKHPDHPDMLDALRAVLRVRNDERFVFREDELAYWLLMYDSQMNWNADLPTRDAMRAGWARACEAEFQFLAYALRDTHARGLPENVYAGAEVRTKILSLTPFLDEVVRVIVSPSATAADAVSLVCSALPNPKKMGDLVHGMLMCFGEDILVEPLKWNIRAVLWAALVSPAATLSGLRRPWLDGRNESGDVEVRYIDLDLTALSEDARKYWINFEFNEIFDLGYVVTSKDVPIPRFPLYKELADLKLDCTAVEADDAICELLAEARENRQWSAPWGARVQIEVGSLKYLDIHELEGEFIGLFRDSHERFMMIPVNVSTGRYSPPMILRLEGDAKNAEENTQAELALVLIVASVVRDFLVVEDRQSQFAARSAKQARCATNQALSVIYLPRVRYLQPDVGAFHKAVAGDTHRAAHDVTPHLRKAEKASAVVDDNYLGRLTTIILAGRARPPGALE